MIADNDYSESIRERARALAKAIGRRERSEDFVRAAALLERAVSVIAVSEEEPEALIRELYRIHIEGHDTRAASWSIPHWLDALARYPRLVLDPDPVARALAELSDANGSTAIHAAVAHGLCGLAAGYAGVDEIRGQSDAVEAIALGHPDCAGVALALYLLGAFDSARLSTKAVERQVTAAPGMIMPSPICASPIVLTSVESNWRAGALDWLGVQPIHPRAHWLVTALVGPHSDGIRPRVVEWVTTCAELPQGQQVLPTLARSNAGRKSVRDLFRAWLVEHDDHDQAPWLLGLLIASNPGDLKVLNRARRWINAHSERHATPRVLGQLIDANRDNDSVRRFAREWIQARLHDPDTFEPLLGLLQAREDDSDARRLAREWLGPQLFHEHADRILDFVVPAASSDAENLQRFFEWLVCSADHRGTPRLLGTLLRICGREDSVRLTVGRWLDHHADHREAPRLLAGLLRVAPRDMLVQRRAIDWILKRGDDPTTVSIVSILLKSRAGDTTLKHNAISRLSANLDDPKFDRLVISLLGASPDDAPMQDLALAWVSAHPTHSRLDRVALAFVQSGKERDVRERFLGWLGENLDHPQFPPLFETLLTTSPAESEWRERALDWLFGHLARHELVATLSSLLDYCGRELREPSARERLARWLAAHADLPHAQDVLYFLFESGADEPEVLKLALDYCCEHGEFTPRSRDRRPASKHQ